MNNTTLSNSTLYEQDTLPLSVLSPIIIFFQTINFSLGLPLNIYVIVLLIRGGGLDSSVIFSLSQVTSEVLFALQTPLFILCQMDKKKLCFLNPVAFFTFLCLSSRLFFQCCVCFERYLAVVHPVLFRKYIGRKYRIVNAAIIWAYSFLSGFVCMNYFAYLPYNIFGILLVIILNMHLFFCFSILRVLRKPGPGERERTDGGASIKKKAFELVFYSLLAFLIQTIPITAACSMKNLLSTYAFKYAFNISIDINIAAGLLQPLIYLHQMGKLTFIHIATVLQLRPS